MKKYKFTKESARKAFRTFIQAAAGYAVINLPLVDFSSGKEVAKSGLIGLAVAATAAGLAAVMNLEPKEGLPESEEVTDDETDIL